VSRVKHIITFTVSIVVLLGLTSGWGVSFRKMNRSIARVYVLNGVEQVRITDFGLAPTADAVGTTQSGMLAGTPELDDGSALGDATLL